LSTTPRSHRAAAGATLPPSPTPDELVVLPEVAILAALQQLLELTTLTLRAVHPDSSSTAPAFDRSRLRPLDLRAPLADQIIELGACLARAVTGYRVAAIDSLYGPDTDDIPF
jgi:hypothetical protein